MYIKKINFALFLVLAIVAGFSFCALYMSGNDQTDLLNGDISKASRYNNVKEDPEMAVIVEKLQNDTVFFNQTMQSVQFLKERVTSLASLSEETAKICGDIPELSSNVPAMNSLSAKASNTSAVFDDVANELEGIASGKKSSEYEQAANTAFIGFQKIENRLDAGKAFVESAGNYLSEKNVEENEDLAGLVALWSVYCAQNAALMDNEYDLKYWGDKLTTDDVTVQALNNTPWLLKFSADLSDDYFSRTARSISSLSQYQETQNYNRIFNPSLKNDFELSDQKKVGDLATPKEMMQKNIANNFFILTIVFTPINQYYNNAMIEGFR